MDALALQQLADALIYKETDLATGATSALLLGNNPRRVAVIFSCTGGVSCVIGPTAGVTATKGLLLQNTTLPLQLAAEEFSTLVQGEWWVISTGAAGTISAIEVFWKG